MSKKSQKDIKNIKDRLVDFNTRLLEFWKPIKDNFISRGRLTMDEMIRLKQNVSDVNNIITLLVTYLFVKQLNDKYHFVKTLNIDDIDNKPNTNGYDFVYKTDNSIIIAEVKCNLPCGGNNTFGPEQKNGIIKDLNGLVNYKGVRNKEQQSIIGKKGEYFNDAFKFMVLLDGNQCAMRQLLDEIEKYDPLNPPKRIKKELKELADNLNDKSKNTNDIRIVEYAKDTDKLLSVNKIYVVYIKPDDNLISELLDNKNN